MFLTAVEHPKPKTSHPSKAVLIRQVEINGRVYPYPHEVFWLHRTGMKQKGSPPEAEKAGRKIVVASGKWHEVTPMTDREKEEFLDALQNALRPRR